MDDKEDTRCTFKRRKASTLVVQLYQLSKPAFTLLWPVGHKVHSSCAAYFCLQTSHQSASVTGLMNAPVYHSTNDTLKYGLEEPQ